MSITWPASLPQKIRLKESRQTYKGGILRTETDWGPKKTRMQFTAVPLFFEGSMYLTATQVATWDTFFYSTISGGATPFEWIHPRTGAAATCLITSDPTLEPAGVLFKLNFAFEVRP